MKIKKCLSELIRILQERRSIERLLQAKHKYEFYKQEKIILKDQVSTLKQEANKLLKKSNHIFHKQDFDINKNNVFEIILVCIMTGISDENYFAHWTDILKALDEVDDSLKPFAKRIDKALEEELELFIEFSEYEIFQIIFY